MIIPPVTASNPYLDFAQANNLNYGDVLNYVGILDGEEKHKSYWHITALLNLSPLAKSKILELKDNLKKHYFKNV